MGTKFKIGDVCRVVIDWTTDTDWKQVNVEIVKVQNNGSTFYRVKWLSGNPAELNEKYGNLFSPLELRKAK